MFGLGLAGLFITLFGILSTISTLIIVACCIVAGDSSRMQDEGFRAYQIQKQALNTLANTSNTLANNAMAGGSISDISMATASHRNTMPKAAHRAPNLLQPQADQAVESAQKAVESEESDPIADEWPTK